MAKNKTEELISIKVDIKHAEKEIKRLTAIIDGNKKAVKNNEAEIKSLAKENKGLSKSVKGSSASQKASSQAMETNTAKLKKLKTATKGLKEQSKDLAKQQKSSKKATDDQKAGLGALGGGLNSAGGAVQSFGGGLKALFTAMKANPILLLAGILISLVMAFKKTQTGAEFFRKASAVLGAVMGNLLDIIEKVGGKLIAAFEDPQKTFEDFKKSIVENVTYYFTDFIPNAVKKLVGGLGLLWDALVDWDIDKAKEGLSQMVDATTDLIPGTALIKKGAEIIKNDLVPALKEVVKETLKDAAAAGKLEEAMMANEKAISDNEVAIKKTIATQSELKEIRDDETKSYAERIEASKQLGDIEEKQATKTEGLLKQKYNLILAQNDLTNSTEEDIQKARDAQNAFIDAENASTTVRRENSKKINALEKREAKEKEAAGKNLLALEEENITKAQELRESDSNQKLNDLLKEANYNKTTLKEKLQGVTDYYDTVTDIATKQREREKKDLAKDKEDILALEGISEEKRTALLEQNRLAELESLRTFEDAKNGIKIEKNSELEEVEDEAQERKLGKLDGFNQKLQLGADIGRAIFDVQNNLIERRYSKMYASLEKQRKNGSISEEAYAKKKEALDKKLAIEKHAIRVKQFALDKATTAIEIGINTARAVAEVLPNPILAGLVGALGAAQLAVVLTSPPPPAPSFADGGEVSSYLVGGKKHSQGGTRYRGEDGNEFEVERGEGIFVTKSDATNDALMALDAINKGYGGNSMFNQSYRWLENGGNAQNQSLDADMVREIVETTVKNMPPSLVRVETIMGGIVAEENAKEVGVIK